MRMNYSILVLFKPCNILVIELSCPFKVSKFSVTISNSSIGFCVARVLSHSFWYGQYHGMVFNGFFVLALSLQWGSCNMQPFVIYIYIDIAIQSNLTHSTTTTTKSTKSYPLGEINYTDYTTPLLLIHVSEIQHGFTLA